MPSPDEEELPAEVDPAYLAFFSESVNDFRAHLSGRDGDDPPPASLFPPRSHWSSAEKDAFFRGLAIHSRLRPDLIAEEVKTKTVPDVCVYLAILEEAERELAQATTYIGEPHRVSEAKCARRDAPAALEVSEEWVTFEERMADTMISLQPTLDQQAVVQARQDEVKAQKITLRAAKGSSETNSKARDREGQKLRREELDKWLAEKRSVWKGEDLLLSLDRTRLIALDRMLRDEEGRGGAEEGVDGYNSEGELAPLPETAGLQLTDGQHSGITHTTEIEDHLIDPALLAISQPSSFPSSASEPGPSRNTVGSSSIPEPSFPVSSQAVHATPPVFFSSLPASPQLSYHTTPATTTVPSVGSGEGSIGDLSQLSPGARRRYQKRLYMRKKRAQATGAVVVDAVERLKPGRKSKKAVSVDDLRAQIAADIPSSPTTPGDALHSPVPSPSHDGLEKARKSTDDKRRMTLASKGIDAQRLHREGFDLFHLQAISKLMQTYNSLHDVPESVASAICGATLSTLRTLVVNFVAEIMSRAIVWREQERVAKLQTKAWRLRENQVISGPNVKQALMLYGAESLNKRVHFARLLGKLGLDDGEDDAGAIDEERQGVPDAAPGHADDAEDNLEEGDDEADRLPLEPLSLLRTIFPPLSNPLSRASKDTSMAVDPFVYMPFPPSNYISGDLNHKPPPSDEDILPEDLDEKLLVDELLEERQLEKWDRHRDIEGERALWARVNARNPHPNLGMDIVDSDLEDFAVEEEQPAAVAITIRKRPQRMSKRKRTEVDTEPAADASGAGAGGDGERNGVTATNGPVGVDEPEAVAPKRQRVGRKAYLSQDALLYMQPGADSRIKSSVYVPDSD